MVEPRRAMVRPRVYADAVSLPLEEEIAARLEAGAFGVVELVGGAGAGKSTALAHLAEVLGDDPLLLLAEDPTVEQGLALARAAADHLVVYVGRDTRSIDPNEQRLRIAAWGEDEWIEYLLAAHRDRCASVVGRLRRDPKCKRLAGATILHRVVLDAMARDETIVDVAGALRCEMVRRLGPKFDAVAEAAFHQSAYGSTDRSVTAVARRHDALPEGTIAMLRHPQVETLLAVEHFMRCLREEAKDRVLIPWLPESLIEGASPVVRENRRVAAWLLKIAEGGESVEQATAVSLLHAAGEDWTPSLGAELLLNGARLRGVKWPGVLIRPLGICQADLSYADLSESRLYRVNAMEANLTGINLRGAYLQRFLANRAALAGADFSQVRAIAAELNHADLRDADLQGASFEQGQFESADLRGARLCRANLVSAMFGNAQLAGADFTGADLSEAYLAGLDLREAEFRGAIFHKTNLSEANLENMVLPGAHFFGARLPGAHLTGSEIPCADFREADLCQTGLAEIQWEKADLRFADLRGATFHMGSSRSGLVGSPLASEGTRTGFYTDDYEEQGFKSPEEIRKANLCGADLRGAIIDDVDFYLVDLRGAQYTASQELHFRRCGAILESRV